jgi:hypothetical protein
MSKYLDPALRELWHYDPATGKFTSKVNTYGHGGLIEIGDEVGTIKDGYVQLGHHGKTYRAHIVAWVWMKGELPPKGREIDHKNKVRNDNRLRNLRLLGRGANNLNHSGPGSKNTTGVRGVHWNVGGRPGTFFARIQVDGKIVHLGTFDTIEEAAEARRRAEIRYWRIPIEEEV